MKARVVFLALLLMTLCFASSAMAVYPNGEINETYKYDDLKIRKLGSDKCQISGEIINKTDQLKDGVYIKIYAYNFHNEFLWSSLLYFSTIPRKDKVKFAETVYDCNEGYVYKLEFKVTD